MTLATPIFDIDSILDGIVGTQHVGDVDYSDGDDGPSWRVYTTSAQAHAALSRRLFQHPTVKGLDCSDVLDNVDREDGGLFGCWIISLRRA